MENTRKLKSTMKTGLMAWVVALAVVPVHAAENQTMTGAGSSAAAPIYRSWAGEYRKESGVSLAYESVGSSAGLKKIRAGETGFGASDVAPPASELARDGLALFPIAITGIAPVVHLPRGVENPVRLSGDVLARIFLGEVTRWNAQEIVQLNPGTALPDLAIKVVVRSDGSGTTYNFTDYLAKVNANWKERYGVKTSVAWPAGFVAVKGSEGVVKSVQETLGAIGYVDYGYVRDNKLHPVHMKNAAGDFLAPSIDAFRAAMNNSEWVSRGEFTATLTGKPGAGVWPITMGTFVVVPLVSARPEQTQAALQFFVWALMNGDALVQKNNFVRLPDRVQAMAFKVMTSVRDKSGHPFSLSLMRVSSSSN